jgi:RsiW-degrading membrane proteinase PrsW (M82 family)
MQNSYLAIAGAALAAWIFGAVYYGVLGKVWQQAQGLDPEQCKGQKMPLAPMAASLISELVMAAIFLHLLQALGLHTWQDGLVTGLMIGVGFMATTNLVNNMFQQNKPALTLIDSLHWIGVAVIEGVVLMLLAG